jgi:hypothetical protein
MLYLALGAIAGLIAKIGIDLVKGGIDLVEAVKGRGAEALLIKGIIDTGLGTFAVADVNMHPRDDFIKGFEWTFGVLEIIEGAISIADAAGFKLGLKVPGLSVEYEKKLLGMAMGREPAEIKLG